MLSTSIGRWLFLLVSLATWVSVINSKEMRVVCYYTNWSVYRPGEGKFSPQNINPYLCTHLIYAFGGFTKDNTFKPFDKYQDIEKGGYAKFTGLKTYNKNLKTMLAIGGWNEGSTRFSPMVASSERRKEFVKNAIKFLRLNHFDGLDLDWEYPSFRDGGKPRDKDNYPLLVQELREEFEREAEKTGRPRLLLTMAVPAGIEYVNKGFDVPKLTKYLDWMNILSYDFHSAFEPAVNHHAPLYSLEEENEYNYESDLNIDYAIKHYLKNGAEPNKLVLGIPTYGRSFTLFNPDAFEIGAPADGPGNMGDATRENGYLAYYEICDYIKNQDWEVEQPNPKVMGPYAFKDNQWVGYDDVEIVKKKAEYVAENNLGGIMFWSIDNDDFRGNCHGKPYPLIEAGRAALINAYGITDDNLIDPPSKPLRSRTRTRTKTVNKSDSTDTEKVEKLEKPTSRRRNRLRQNKEKAEKSDTEEISYKTKSRRRNNNDEETSSYSSLKIVTPSYTTPAPPSTPEMDGGFTCKDEGFYSHPKDCKKYFWCLNGAGDSGIIAHQFTCPAGLYFNKAADSCDYTQNVLCKKSVQKSTRAPEIGTPTTTPTSILFSTSRAPPKITAATSRTTFRHTTTTTTEAYEDDEEYDDDQDDEKENERKDSEEDPKVIKELIELIRRAGGIEELEKQFHLKPNSSSGSDQTTTKSPIFSKSLYERVLSKAIKNTPNAKVNRNLNFQNSRGPQSLKTENDAQSDYPTKTDTGKLKYTSTSRFRSSITREKEIDEEDENENDQVKEQNIEKKLSRKATDKYPSYTNIRRPKVGTTTSEPEYNNRNKILGETDDENDDDTDDEEKEDDYVLTTKRTSPQYVNIRRQRPTTEETSTSKYLEIRRGTSTENSPSPTVEQTYTSKYKILRRSTTTTSQPEIDDPQLSSSIRSRIEETTLPSGEDILSKSTSIGDNRNRTSEDDRNEYIPNVITTTGTYINTTDEFNNIKSETNESKSSDTSNISSKPNILNSFHRKRPQLFEPRPFTKPTEASTLRPRTTQTTKVSETSFDLTTRNDSENSNITREKSQINFRSRGNSRFNTNRNPNTAVEKQEKQASPGSKRRIVVTEKYVEENRPYRPSEIADLSSLTAVDFDNIKGLNSRTNLRRRRPLKPSAATEKTIDLENTPDTLKRRRIYLGSTESTSEESRQNLHKTTTTTESTSLATSRNRKVIRRFRTSTLAPVPSQLPEEDNSLIQPKQIQFKPTKSLLDIPSKNNEVDDDGFEDSTTEEDENIKLSESNIRENSDINSFNHDPKLKQKLIKSDDIYGKSSVYFKNVGKTGSVLEEQASSAVYFSPTTSTEPSVFSRTRKIVRKIVPTPSTRNFEETNTNPVFGRKRKIIRKFRPASELHKNSTDVPSTTTKIDKLILTEDSVTSKLELDEIEEESGIGVKDATPNIPKRLLRPKLGGRRVTAPTEEVELTTAKTLQRNKTVLLRGPSRYYNQKFSSTSNNKDSSTESIVELERSSPKYFRSRFSTTVSDNLPEISDELEKSSPKYIIQRFRTTPSDNDEKLLESSELEKSSPKYVFVKEPTASPLELEKSNPKYFRPNPRIKYSDNDEEHSQEFSDPILRTNDEDFVTDTAEKLVKSTPKYTIISRPKSFNISTTENIVKEDEINNIITTDSPEDHSTEIVMSSYSQDEEKLLDTTTVDYSILEATSTTPVEFTSTEHIFTSRDNDINSDVNTQYTDEPPTTFHVESFSTKLTKLDELDSSIINSQQITETEDVATDTTSELPGTTIFETSATPSQDYISMQHRSTLRTIESRPKYNPSRLKALNNGATTEASINAPRSRFNYRNRFQSTNNDFKSTTEKLDAEPEGTKKGVTRFNRYRPGFSIKNEDILNNRESTSVLPIKKPSYKYRKPKPSSIQNNLHTNSEQYEEDIIEEPNNENVKDIEQPKSRYVDNKYTKTSRPTHKPFTPSFSKSTTEESNLNEELKDINTDAVKNRNKSLFKNRKINPNLLNPSTSPSTVSTEEPTTYENTDFDNIYSTQAPKTESTENYTNLIHVFIDKGDTTEIPTSETIDTTEGLDIVNHTTTRRVEKLIEVNRIINVKTKEDIIKNHHLEHGTDKESSPYYDKIGAINRVTVIKVVDKDGHLVNNNETDLSPVYTTNTQTTESPIKSSVDMIIQIAKIEEVSPPKTKVNLTNLDVQIKEETVPVREERKFDFILGGKVDDSKVRETGKAEIIDGISHINVITPRPISLPESSTIALEGLFQTEKPTLFSNNNSINDEVLETENSKYVNVRILHPDEEVKLNEGIKNPPVIPIKLLKQDNEDFIMRARVVEVSPKSAFNSIRIVPIKVESSKKMPPSLPLIRINRQHN